MSDTSIEAPESPPAEEVTESRNSDPETNPDVGIAEDQEPEPEDEQADPEESNPNKEAAKWRHRYRDEQTAHNTTQEALTAATAKVEALQRQQVEGMLSAANVKPAALWATTKLGDLLAEDGSVDADAVNEAISKARDTLGIQPVSKGTFAPGLGSRPNRLPETSNPWKDAFAPKKK